MKYPIILLLFLFSCSKEKGVVIQPIESVDNVYPTASKPGKGQGNGNNPTPPPPTPPPTTATGTKCILVVFGREYVSGYWGTFYSKPSLVTQSQQTEIINYSAAHYAPYNVQVTTNRFIYDTTNVLNRAKVIVTDSAIRSGTGVAVVGSFGTSMQECFVFSAALGNISKYIGDIVSHEAGHTLGLYHQTVCTNGVITNQWRDGAIMGYPYNHNPAAWVTGTTYNCTTFQNDHQILTTKLGLR